jgi:purine-binding chemotaxis protein CheW
MSDKSNPRQLVVFTLAGEQYALPIRQVHEIIRYTQPRPVASSGDSVRGVISLRGRIVPVRDLAARLGAHSEADEQSRIVIVDSGSEILGVIVDAVEEVLTVADEQLEQPPAGTDSTLVDAIAQLGDRLVVLLAASTIFTAIDTPGG